MKPEPLHNPECKHESVWPEFDEEEAKQHPAFYIRKRWPRFDGVCPDCKETVILYASWAHYVLGCW
jgi:hypothetical protein